MSELTLKDVTPQVEIVFKKLAASVITMQEKGRVLFIAKDATLTEDYTVKTYTSAVGITDITVVHIKTGRNRTERKELRFRFD